MPHLGFLRDFTREVMAGYVGEFLREMMKSMGTKVGEEGGVIFLERIKKSLAEERENVAVFIRHNLRQEGGDYERAAKNLLKAQELRQRREPRPYGDRRRYPPGAENQFMNALALMSAVFNEPPKPEPPQPTGGGQQQQQQQGGQRGQQQRRQGAMNPQVFQTLWRQYKDDLQEWKKDRDKKVEERIKFFRELGLMSFKERDAYVEAVVDDSLKQILAIPGFKFKEGLEDLKQWWLNSDNIVRRAAASIDEAAGKAAPHVGRLADWINAQP